VLILILQVISCRIVLLVATVISLLLKKITY